MSAIIYTSNLGSERIFHIPIAIWICGNRIQLRDRSEFQIYGDLKRVSRVLRRSHHKWLKDRNSASKLSDDTNTFYIECYMPSYREPVKVPVDHLGVRWGDGFFTDRSRTYEIHGAFGSYVTRTKGLRDKESVWTHKLPNLLNQFANRYYEFSKPRNWERLLGRLGTSTKSIHPPVITRSWLPNYTYRYCKEQE
jgi:hypothetical protein